MDDDLEWGRAQVPEDDRQLPPGWEKSNPDFPRHVYHGQQQLQNQVRAIEMAMRDGFKSISGKIDKNTELTAKTKNIVAGVDAVKTTGRIVAWVAGVGTAILTFIGATIAVYEKVRSALPWVHG